MFKHLDLVFRISAYLYWSLVSNKLSNRVIFKLASYWHHFNNFLECSHHIDIILKALWLFWFKSLNPVWPQCRPSPMWIKFACENKLNLAKYMNNRYQLNFCIYSHSFLLSFRLLQICILKLKNQSEIDSKKQITVYW